jgi:glycosyltransferase involved in cell wall biosynthesis
MNVNDNAVRNPETAPEPLVSVLVPSYNHQEYVIECLESIKNLRYPRLELILSDDCSSDATYELAEHWVQDNLGRFERAIAIRQPKNLGVVRNLQFLFDSAQGEYLAYIASDDVFVESSITDRLSLLLKDNSIDAVIGDSQLISESGAILQERRIPAHLSNDLCDKATMTGTLIRYWRFMCSAAMIRRKALIEGGSIGRLPENLRIEDRYIFVRLAAQGKLGYANSIVAKYRHAVDSLSRAPAGKRYGLIGFLECDRRNSYLLKGLDRYLLDLSIASCNVFLNADNRGALYYVKQGSIKIAILVLWTLLRIRRIILRQVH